MSAVLFLALVRIVIYAVMAGYALKNRRWAVWGVFTALVASTYIYSFTGLSAMIVELIRTVVACGLIYITLERK